MKVLVLYDSLYGNTKKVAEAVAGALKKFGTVKLVPVKSAKLTDLKSVDLLVVGSPTHAGRAKPELQAFLDSIPTGGLRGKRVAAFDTRVAAADVNVFLKLLITVIGFAAPKITKTLVAKGGTRAADPAGFIVTGKEGPLKDGELPRVAKWASSL